MRSYPHLATCGFEFIQSVISITEIELNVMKISDRFLIVIKISTFDFDSIIRTALGQTKLQLSTESSPTVRIELQPADPQLVLRMIGYRSVLIIFCPLL